MADPYYSRYVAPERDITDTRAAFSGYRASEGSALASRSLWDGSNLRISAEFGKSEILPLSRDYGLGDYARIGSHATTGVGGLAAGASAGALTPLEDLTRVRRDGVLGVKPRIADYEKPDPLRKSEGLSADESNMLFVDGLSKDCTRREVAHLFRPFIGFKEIRVVHKEARRSGDKAYVLCFVEFNDSKCALTAMEALQEYGTANRCSPEGDVYSYGMLLLEMFTGKRPIDDALGEGRSLRKYVELAFPEQIFDVMDANLLSREIDDANDDVRSIFDAGTLDNIVSSILRIGLLCSHEVPTRRPKMTVIVMHLHVIRDAFLRRKRVWWSNEETSKLMSG